MGTLIGVPLRLWTYDIAREQNPQRPHLDDALRLTQEGGYDGIGLYLEHRFAYPSAPWAHGQGCVTPADITSLESSYPEVDIIPFINLLGHTEGFLYTEPGKRFAEERFKGLQACPSCPEFVAFAEGILDDTIAAFRSPIIHLGGDETAQLARCPRCAGTPAAELYARHFGPLCERTINSGRRPALWADMFREHPEALDHIPKETLLFEWEYFDDPRGHVEALQARGFEVVLCPTLHTYNSTWMNLEQAQANVDTCRQIAQETGAGFCLTTWEAGLFGNYETLFPAIRAVGTNEDILGAYTAESENSGHWAKLMGVDLVALCGPFAAGRIRSGLKCRLLLYSNPFLAWMHHAEDLCGPVGDEAMKLADEAMAFAPTISARGVSVFLRKAVEFVRFAEQARQAYADGQPGLAAASLSPCRQIFEDLEKVAVASEINAGGSRADIYRCRAAREHVERVIRRIKEFGDGQLGYLPAFEILTHPKFMPHDQASWWLVNSWANE